MAVRPPVALICPPPPYAGTCRATNTLKPHFPAALPARVLALSGGLPIRSFAFGASGNDDEYSQAGIDKVAAQLK